MNTRRSKKAEDVHQDCANPAPRSNGMRRFAGTWTAEEHQQFEESIASLEEIDVEMWTDELPH